VRQAKLFPRGAENGWFGLSLKAERWRHRRAKPFLTGTAPEGLKGRFERLCLRNAPYTARRKASRQTGFLLPVQR
jgi:hypothetical protein